MTEAINRAVKISVSVESGEDILQRGMFVASKLWNNIWWCAVGYNSRLAWNRGDFVSKKGRLPKYPGRFGIDKEMRDHWAYVELSDRTAGTIVQEFDIAMKSWFSNLKTNPDARPPRPRSERGKTTNSTLSFSPGRNMKHLGDWRFRLTVLGGSVERRHAIVKLHVRPGVKVADIRMLKIGADVKNGRYQSVIIVQKEAEETAVAGGRVAAMDLGINNLGALAFDSGETVLYSGRALLDAQRYYQKKMADCMPSGWSKGKPTEKHSARRAAYGNKLTNIMNLAIHNFTTDVIRQCQQRGVTTLVIGQLKGIRKDKDFGKRTNQKLHRWPFLKIADQLRYKGEERGIKVIEVSEAYTSQTCADCGTRDKGSRVKRGLYRCRTCGIEMNADLNGAVNLLKKVSPDQKFGVVAAFPGERSTQGVSDEGIREVDGVYFASHPDFVAKFDLRDYHLETAPTHTCESTR